MNTYKKRKKKEEAGENLEEWLLLLVCRKRYANKTVAGEALRGVDGCAAMGWGSDNAYVAPSIGRTMLYEGE